MRTVPFLIGSVLLLATTPSSSSAEFSRVFDGLQTAAPTITIQAPTSTPTFIPTLDPTQTPTVVPTQTPAPTNTPTPSPTASPTPTTTETPTPTNTPETITNNPEPPVVKSCPVKKNRDAMNTGFYVLQSKCAEDGEVAVATSQATLNSLPPRQRSHIREEVLSIGREEIKADDVADDLCKKRRTVKKETTPKVSTSISARAAPVKDASVCIDGFGWGGLGGKKPSAAMIGIAYGNLRRCFAGLREDKREEINPGGTKFPSMNMSGLCLGEACGYFPSLTAAKKSGYEYVAGACGQPKSSSGSSAGPVYQANLTGDDCKIIGDANAKNVCLVAGSSEGAKCAALARSRGATAGGAVPQYILITEGADSSILPTPFSVAASKYANGECGAIIGSGIELNASARVLSYYWENQVKLAVSLGGIEPPVFACKDRSTAVDFSARFERFASQMESCSVNTSWKVACELTGFSTRRCIAVTPKV